MELFLTMLPLLNVKSIVVRFCRMMGCFDALEKGYVSQRSIFYYIVMTSDKKKYPWTA